MSWGGVAVPDIVLWGSLGLWLALWTSLRWWPSAISWHHFDDGVHWLFATDGLHLFAHHPDLQLGPLSLVLSAPFTLVEGRAGPAGIQLACSALGLLALYLATRACSVSPPRWLVAAAGAFLIPAWTVLSVRWLHPDDVFAVVFAMGALAAVRARRGWLAGLLLGAAVASKPWALGFEPILFAMPRRLALRGLGVAVAVLVVVWTPFFIADPGTFGALRAEIGFSDSSVLHLFGMRGESMPVWLRPVQLLGGLVIASLVVRRGQWQSALLAAFAFRLALDPHDVGYYQASAVAFAAVSDLEERILLWMPITAALLWEPFVTDYARRFDLADPLGLYWFQHPHVVAAVHLAWAAAVVIWCLRRRAPLRSDVVVEPRAPAAELERARDEVGVTGQALHDYPSRSMISGR